jgi:hypothetical protein
MSNIKNNENFSEIICQQAERLGKITPNRTAFFDIFLTPSREQKKQGD